MDACASTFQLDTEEGLLRVKEGEFVIVPKGTKHRPVVASLTKFLMVELDGTKIRKIAVNYMKSINKWYKQI